MCRLSKGLICLVSLAVLAACAGSPRAPDFEPAPAKIRAVASTSDMKWRERSLATVAPTSGMPSP